MSLLRISHFALSQYRARVSTYRDIHNALGVRIMALVARRTVMFLVLVFICFGLIGRPGRVSVTGVLESQVSFPGTLAGITRQRNLVGVMEGKFLLRWHYGITIMSRPPTGQLDPPWSYFGNTLDISQAHFP